MITVTLCGLQMFCDSLCLRFFVRVSPGLARVAIVLGFVKCKVKKNKRPDPSHAVTVLASPIAPPWWGVSSTFVAQRRLTPLAASDPKSFLSDAYSEKGPTGFCALV